MSKADPNVLTIREAAFVAAYAEFGNATQAAMAAFNPKSVNYAGVLGFRMLRKDKVRKAIRREMIRKTAAFDVTKNRLIAHLGRIAFGDMGEFIEADSRGMFVLRDAREMPKEQLTAIKSVDVLRTTTRTGIGGEEIEEQVIRVTLHSPDSAMAQLFKYLGLMFDRTDLAMIREELRDAAEASKYRRPTNTAT